MPSETTSDTPDAPDMDMHVLERTSEQLAEKYRGTFPPELVERYVFESYAALARTAKVRTFLAATAGHFADDRLRSLARSADRQPAGRPQVLFVCSQNAGRSQIAAALLAKVSGGAVDARSAGFSPAAELHPLAVQALRERGIDLRDAYPKPLTDDVVRAADYLVTMGRGNPILVYPGKQYLDWDFEEPRAATPEQAREIVAGIEAKVAELWERIRPAQEG